MSPRRDPATAEEEELLENLFGVACACLMLPENKVAFVEAEGESGDSAVFVVGQAI